MSKKNRKKRNGKENRNDTYVVFNLITEYGCRLNGCKYAVASRLEEEKLRKERAKELLEYEPFIYLNYELAEPMLESNRNTWRWNKRNLRSGNYIGYVDGFTNGKNISDSDLVKDPADILIEREEKQERERVNEKLKRACDGLNEKQRGRIDRRFYDEKSLKEIAREDGVRVSTIEDALSRALAALRKSMSEDETD